MHFKNFSFFLILILVACKSSPAKLEISAEVKQNLQIQIDRMSEAMISSDYETLVKYTYPAIVEKAGGMFPALELIKKELDELARQGVTFDSLSIGKPTVFVRAGKEIHTIIPQTIFLKVPRGKLRSEGSIIAISNDEGKTWYFLDTANLDSSNVRRTLPNYNYELKIPPSKEPVPIESND